MRLLILFAAQHQSVAFNVLLEVGNAFSAEQSPEQDPQNSP